MIEEQLVTPPFIFGDVVDAFTLEDQYCFNNRIFDWLRENAGKKNIDWLSRVTGPRGSYLSFCISIRIKNPATEIQFRFMNSDAEVKLTRDAKGCLTHIPRK
jgi:hypothetical protein